MKDAATTPIKKFKNEQFVGHFTNPGLDHIFQLSDSVANKIKLGEYITEELLELFILDFLTNNPLLRSQKNSHKNIIIITEKFLASCRQGQNEHMIQCVSQVYYSLFSRSIF